MTALLIFHAPISRFYWAYDVKVSFKINPVRLLIYCGINLRIDDLKLFRNSDLIIYPDGRIQDAWCRKRGHALTKEDLQALLDAGPEVIIAGTGIHGRMKPDSGLGEALGKMGIQFLAGPNDQAVSWFNDRIAATKAGACFHLAC
jgi:hypothetical protein